MITIATVYLRRMASPLLAAALLAALHLDAGPSPPALPQHVADYETNPAYRLHGNPEISRPDRDSRSTQTSSNHALCGSI